MTKKIRKQIGADNTNTNYGRNHAVFSIIKLEVLNLLKSNNVLLRNKQLQKYHFFSFKAIAIVIS